MLANSESDEDDVFVPRYVSLSVSCILNVVCSDIFHVTVLRGTALKRLV